MSIDLSRVTGISDSRGVITEIKDSLGRVIWKLPANDLPIVLGVEKDSFTSYAGETSYSSDCVLLDIYPKKSNSTVKVTYGGLTKTLSFSGTNAQQVFFGSYNGETDGVTTPASGTLTIEGGCGAFGCGLYQSSSKESMTNRALCVLTVSDWGSIEYIPDGAFNLAQSLTVVSLPTGITSIGKQAFYYCNKINITEIPHGVKTIKDEAFYLMAPAGGGRPVTQMTEMTLPETIESIGAKAFSSTGEGYLSKIVILATTPPALGTGAISLADRSSSELGIIVVPKGCGDLYKTAEGWSTYAQFITEAT